MALQPNKLHMSLQPKKLHETDSHFRVDICFAGQEIPDFAESEACYNVQRHQPTDPIFTQLRTAHTLSPYIQKIVPNTRPILPPKLRLPSNPFT